MGERIGPITQKFPVSEARKPANSSHLALMGAERVEKDSEGWKFSSPLLTRLGDNTFALFVPTSDIQGDKKNLFVFFIENGAVEVQKVAVGTTPVSIGREGQVGSDTIVKQDRTVSRLHGSLQRDPSSDAFILKNISNHNSLLVYPGGVFEVQDVSLLASMYPRPDIAVFSPFDENAVIRIVQERDIVIEPYPNQNRRYEVNVVNGGIVEMSLRAKENAFIPISILPERMRESFDSLPQVVLPVPDLPPGPNQIQPYSPAGFIILRSTPQDSPRLFVVGFASDDMVVVGRLSDFSKPQQSFQE